MGQKCAGFSGLNEYENEKGNKTGRALSTVGKLFSLSSVVLPNNVNQL